MKAAQVSMLPTRPIFRWGVKEWLDWVNRYLGNRSQFRNWHFWMIQGLVIVIAIMHSMVEAPGVLHGLGVLFFIPFFITTSLFLVPVVYAALTFGLTGAMRTALWATFLTIPNWIFWHQGLAKFECMFQLLIVNIVAFLVGRQVEREKGARRQTEATSIELRASRMKYRSLFESSPVAILVVNHAGNIIEVNPAACTLFGKDKTALEGVPFTSLFGQTDRLKLMSFSQDGRGQVETLTFRPGDGAELYLERTLAETSDGEGNLVSQVLLRDVTKEQERQAGLKAYAAYVMRAQEEERKRIARELHDETIQSLALLYRRLDSLQGDNESLPFPVIDALRESKGIAEEVMTELRDFTKSLRPPSLDDLGMVTSIRRLLADFIERAGITGKVKVVGEEQRLPPDTEVGMFRIAQEALRNIESHAKATRVAVTITFAKDSIRLEVVDNGMGFSLPSDSRDLIESRQLGLISMQERAELLNGKVEIKSSPGKGTRVLVSIPVVTNTAEVAEPRV